MKKILLLLSILLLNGALQAQKHVYEDLLVLYVDEKYEKCIYKAEGYTQNDATKRDPLPFLYVSMCFYEMAGKDQFAVDYPKASRDAMKWAEKYRRKDKDLEFWRNYEDYWMSLNAMALDEGENALDDPKGGTRSRQVFTSMTKYHPENPGPWLLLAITQYKSNLAKDGDISRQEFDKALAAAGDITTLSADQKKALKTALIRYADYQIEKGNKEEARKYVAMGKDAFMGDDDFKGLYNSLF